MTSATAARFIARAPQHSAAVVRSAPPQAVLRNAPPHAALSPATSTQVSSPGDAAEREATRVARQIVTMPEAPRSAQVQRHPSMVARSAVAFAARGASALNAAVASRAAGVVPSAGNATGQPLPASVRRFMEPRFRADFSAVRMHTGPTAARASRQLNAAAFAVGHQIFFGEQRFQPESTEGRELIAHELVHTLQQGGAVQRSALPAVVERVAPMAQRSFLGIPDPREYFAGKANAIPGFTMLSVVAGINPITNARVERSAGNLLRGAIELMPGGSLVTEALNAHGVFDKVSGWAQAQFAALQDIGSGIWQDIESFIQSFDITDLADLGGLWARARAIVERPVHRVMAFAVALKDGVVGLIKDAILKPVAAFAGKTKGYALLCTVMGKDPITGAAVPQDAEALVGGFMAFIGEDELWANMQKANAVPRAFAWFKGALAGLRGFVNEIPGLFVQAFHALELLDIILIPRAFGKLAGVFGSFAGRFVIWGANAVWILLEIVFDAVSPGALGYIKKTGSAIKSIFKNPLPFVGNLVKAAKQGFLNFGSNLLGHLKAGLIDWLTGSLPGVYIPKAFSLGEIAKFAFSVLGLSWVNIRQKLVRAVGEPAVKAMETGFDTVVSLVRDGPAAAWDKLKEQLSNLKDMVIGGITDFVIDMVVKKAIPKLIAMFIPGAGFISAILSIYDTVMVFVNKIAKIIQVVTGFIDSLVAIAGGAVGAAAAKVESTLAGLLALAINFLAGFAGLGKVADKVMEVINKIRAPIDKALDWLIGWIVGVAKKLFAKAFGAKGADPTQKPSTQVIAAVKKDLDAKAHKVNSASSFRSMIDSLASRHGPDGLSAIRVRKVNDGELVIEGAASPFTFLSQVRRLVTSDDGYTSAAVAFDDQIFGRPVNNDRRKAHAEEKIVAMVRNALRLKKPGQFPSKVEVFVTQSPCRNRCAPALSDLKAAFPEVKQWIVYYTEPYMGSNQKHAEDSQEAIEMLRTDGFHVLEFNAAIEMSRQGKASP